MTKIKDIIDQIKQEKYIFFLLGLIISVGLFLRIFYFGAWMPFELDQARDVFVIYDVVHGGFENLPLLGPQARGRELFLGPIFYYFSLLSSIVFGVSPEAVALPDLLSSICAIPLFYFFSQLFFSRFVSVSLTAIVATSLFLVTYGRFAWNPNGMFFWSLATFYSLLRAYDHKKFDARWFILFVCGLSVLTQLHFISFIVAPLVAVVYMIMRKIVVPFRVIILSLCVWCFFYMPVILSEIKNNGHNSRMFFASIAMNEESESDANVASDLEHDLVEKVFRYMQETSTFYWNIVSADNNGRKHIRTDKKDQGYFPLICDEKCIRSLPHHIVAMCFFAFTLGIFIFFAFSHTRKNACDEDALERKQRFLLVLLWISFGSVFLILVAYQISPRFYLFLVAPLLIIFGVLLESVEKFGFRGRIIVGVIISIFVGANLFMSWQYFGALHQAEQNYFPIKWRDIAMNRDDIVTLAQLRRAGEFVEVAKDELGEKFVILGDNRYARALYYIVSVEENDKDVLCYIKRGGFNVEKMRGVTYFMLAKTASASHINKEMLATHSIDAQKKLGTITLYKLVPHDKSVQMDDLSSQCFTR